MVRLRADVPPRGVGHSCGTDDFALNTKWFATGGENLQPWTFAQQNVDQNSARIQQVLAIVEHQELVRVAHRVCKRLFGCSLSIDRDAKYRRHPISDEHSIGDGRQFNQLDSVAKAVGNPAGHFNRQMPCSRA